MSAALSPEVIARAALNSNGFKPSHNLGQNFLLRQELLEELLSGIEFSEETQVLEIGPGAGVMTALLETRATRVIAVELDRRLKPVLDAVLHDHPKAEVLYQDILKMDIDALVRERFHGAEYIVIANLPYYITTEVLETLVSLASPPEAICIMVQKEAAERILSCVGSKQWCHLGAVTALYGDGAVLANVPRTCFEPQPNVDSVFLSIQKHTVPVATPIDDDLYRKVLKSAFYMRRKTLLNNMKAVFSLSREEAEKVLTDAGIPWNVRGEALTLQELCSVSDALYQFLNP